MRAYGGRRTYDTPPQMKASRARVKKEGEELVAEQVASEPPSHEAEDCPICGPNVECPEHPDPAVWPNKNEWSIVERRNYQGIPYWYLKGPAFVSFERAKAALDAVRVIPVCLPVDAQGEDT